MKRTILTVLATILLFSTSSFAADLHLRWDPSPSATGYKIRISVDNGQTWGEIRNTGSAVPEYTWLGAPDDVTAMFIVGAYNAQGFEVWNVKHGVFANETWEMPAPAGGLGIQ